MAYDNSAHAARETKRLREYDTRFWEAFDRRDRHCEVLFNSLRDHVNAALHTGNDRDPTMAGYLEECRETLHTATSQMQHNPSRIAAVETRQNNNTEQRYECMEAVGEYLNARVRYAAYSMFFALRNR